MHLKSLIFIIFILCLLTNPVLAKTVTVEPSGYSDQDVINQAIQKVYYSGEGDAKVILAPGTFRIDGKIIIKPKIEIQGSKGTVIEVADNSKQWFVGRDGLFSMSGILTDIKIHDLLIDGNCENLPTSYANYNGGVHNAGRGIYLIMSTGEFGRDIELYNLTIQDCYSDGINLCFWDGVSIHDCYIRNTQHECVFLVDCRNAEVYNCYFESITSDGVRFDNCVRTKAYNNYITSYFGPNNHGTYEGGTNGFQVGDEGYSHGGGSPKPDPTNDIEIYNNVIENIGLAGILLGTTGQDDNENVYVHHNTIRNCGYGAHAKAQYGAGIAVKQWVDGIEITHNTIDGCYQEGILIMKTLGTVTATVSENNIINTKGESKTGTGYPAVGWGIYNGASTMELDVTGNYFAGNLNGDTNIANEDPAGTMIEDAGGNGNSMMDVIGINDVDYTPDQTRITVPDLTTDTFFEALEDVYTQVPDNVTVILPDGIDKSPTKGLVKVEYRVMGNNTTTYVKMSEDRLKGVSEVKYKIDGQVATHTLMLGSRTTHGIAFTETSLWEGELRHEGNDLVIPGKVDLSKIDVTCVTPKHTFQPVMEATTVEVKPITINPIMIGIFFEVILSIFLFIMFLSYF